MYSATPYMYMYSGHGRRGREGRGDCSVQVHVTPWHSQVKRDLPRMIRECLLGRDVVIDAFYFDLAPLKRLHKTVATINKKINTRCYAVRTTTILLLFMALKSWEWGSGDEANVLDRLGADSLISSRSL